jgi:hypothetical protein
MLSASVLAAPASASGYPQRPVTFISPFQAGGATDLMARVLAQKLGAALGQPFVVENRVGATGLIGETAVLRAKPDGYTILIASNSSHVIAPLLQAKRPFHPVNDFEPISMLSSYPLALTVGMGSPFKSVADLLAQAKTKPGTLNFGSVGQGSVIHLVSEQFAQQGQVKLTHIPYKGTPALTTALLSGEIEMRFDSVGSTKPLVNAGRAKVLAISGPTRSALMPQVPTLREAGVSGVDALVWVGAFAPKGTPQPIVDLLREKMQLLLRNDPEVKRVLADNGMDPIGSQSTEFAKAIADESNRWSQLLSRIDLQLN